MSLSLDKDFWFHLLGVISVILTVMKMRKDDKKTQKDHHEEIAKIQEARHLENQNRLQAIETNLAMILPWFRDNIINRKI